MESGAPPQWEPVENFQSYDFCGIFLVCWMKQLNKCGEPISIRLLLVTWDFELIKINNPCGLGKIMDFNHLGQVTFRGVCEVSGN